MQNIFNSSLTKEYNIDYLIRAYVYNDSESTNLFSYKLGNAGNSFSHLTGIVSALIGGVEDFVVGGMKNITGLAACAASCDGCAAGHLQFRLRAVRRKGSAPRAQFVP